MVLVSSNLLVDQLGKVRWNHENGDGIPDTNLSLQVNQGFTTVDWEIFLYQEWNLLLTIYSLMMILTV